MISGAIVVMLSAALCLPPPADLLVDGIVPEIPDAPEVGGSRRSTGHVHARFCRSWACFEDKVCRARTFSIINHRAFHACSVKTDVCELLMAISATVAA